MKPDPELSRAAERALTPLADREGGVCRYALRIISELGALELLTGFVFMALIWSCLVLLPETPRPSSASIAPLAASHPPRAEDRAVDNRAR